jgi:hypothetical protein
VEGCVPWFCRLGGFTVSKGRWMSRIHTGCAVGPYSDSMSMLRIDIQPKSSPIRFTHLFVEIIIRFFNDLRLLLFSNGYERVKTSPFSILPAKYSCTAHSRYKCLLARPRIEIHPLKRFIHFHQGIGCPLLYRMDLSISRAPKAPKSRILQVAS